MAELFNHLDSFSFVLGMVSYMFIGLSCSIIDFFTEKSLSLRAKRHGKKGDN